MKLIVGLSYAPDDNPRYGRYRIAVEKAAAVLEYEIEVVELSKHPGRVNDLDGIVFTGGVDIQPARYGKQAEVPACVDIDESRDQAEFAIADAVEMNSIPTLGICRGLQLLNVHRGGTLITDLQTYGARDHKRLNADQDSRHKVKITQNSYLSKILNRREGEINSAHHQGIERVGDGYVVSARAEEDGTIEAIEWADMTGKPFFLAVQWHPERMQYQEDFSGRLFETFLWEVAAHKTLRGRIGTVRTNRMDEDTPIPEVNGSPRSNGNAPR